MRLQIEKQADTVVGQYHWVSEFAPPRFQKGMSYTVGTCRSINSHAEEASDEPRVVDCIGLADIPLRRVLRNGELLLVR